MSKLMNKNMVELTEANSDTEALQTAIPVAVDFYAPWCGPCQRLAPLLEQFAATFAARLKFTKANVDETSELAARFAITTLL